MKKLRFNGIIILLITLGLSSCNDTIKESKASEPKQTLTPTQEAIAFKIKK